MNNQALYISTSIANWKDKLTRRFDIPEWHWLKSRGKRAIFFGMYNPVDYFRFLWHKGDKTVFWCGSDILNLQKRPFWQKILWLANARHICENVVEKEALRDMGIESDIHPCLFDKMDDVEISYQRKERPQIWMTCHKGREVEYGIGVVEGLARLFRNIDFHIYGVDELRGEFWYENIKYHGRVLNERFDEEIKKYQGCIRLNKFDGFSEILAKSVLMGQYQYSVIPYPYMESGDLIQWLRTLEWRKKPNIKGRNYWKAKLTESLYEIIR